MYEISSRGTAEQREPSDVDIFRSEIISYLIVGAPAAFQDQLSKIKYRLTAYVNVYIGRPTFASWFLLRFLAMEEIHGGSKEGHILTTRGHLYETAQHQGGH